MAKEIKAKSAFVKKHRAGLDEETTRFIMQPETRIWREPNLKGVYAAFHRAGLRVFCAK